MRHARTLIGHSLPSLLSSLSSLPPALTHHSLFYALSSSLPPATLSALTSHLARTYPSSLGALTAPLPGKGPALSLAWFDKKHAIPFRSDIPGRTRVAVGRKVDRIEISERRAGGMDDAIAKLAGEKGEWKDVWAGDVEALPDPLRHLSPNAVHTVLTLTDDAPHGLFRVLHAFPNAHKLGLTASPTPFVTGRPHTLLYNGQPLSSGAVGLALLDLSPRPALETGFPALRAISEEMTVTQADGNLVHTLDGANPSAKLLEAIKAASIDPEDAKEGKFYLGLVSHGQLVQPFPITSGDPKRGTLALENDAAPPPGARVQIFHLPANAPVEVPITDKHTLSFITVPDSHGPMDDGSEGGDGVAVLEGVFVAGSEGGVVLGAEGGEWWRAGVVGGTTSLRWPASVAARA